MKSILPEDLHGEIPVGFNTAGHVGTPPFSVTFIKFGHN